MFIYNVDRRIMAGDHVFTRPFRHYKNALAWAIKETEEVAEIFKEEKGPLEVKIFDDRHNVTEVWIRKPTDDPYEYELIAKICEIRRQELYDTRKKRKKG